MKLFFQIFKLSEVSKPHPRHIIFIADACFTGTLVRGESAGMNKDIAAVYRLQVYETLAGDMRINVNDSK